MDKKQPELPTISVCVICYNHADYLEECLESITRQVLSVPLEIVVADDASTDGSDQIIRRFAEVDPRIRLLRQNQNVGARENVRRGLQACRGEFIAVCEGDDYWTNTTKLATQLTVFTEAEVSLCLTAGIRVSEKGEFHSSMRPFEKTRDLTLEELILSNKGQVPTASMVMRGSVLRALPEEIYCQPILDYPLQVLLGARGRARYLDLETCAYRLAATGSWSEMMARDPGKMVAHHEQSRQMQQFFARTLGLQYAPVIRRAFEAWVMGFYFSSRIPQSAKRRNLSADLGRLPLPKRVPALLFGLVPGLSRVASLVRRRIQNGSA